MSTDDKAHTPGPWHATLHQVGDENNVRVADCYSLEKGHDTARANARLIAAAPDLLAALVEIEQHAYDDDTPQEDILADFDRMRGIARDAIAKARGAEGEWSELARLRALNAELVAALEALLLLADPCESAVGIARAAIAKARGEQA